MSGGFFENFLGNIGLVGGGAGGLVGGAVAGAAVEGAIGAGSGAVIGGAGGALAGGVGAIPGAAGGAAVGGAAGAGVGAWTGGAAGAVAGAATGYSGGKAAGAWVDQTAAGQYVNEKVEDFKQWLTGDEAADKADAKATAITCATCAQNPCAKYACGVPGGKYRGGAHGCMTGTDETRGDELDSHHMPAKSKSPLNPAVGPAIQMDPTDHAKTASYKGRVNGPTYAPQRALLSRGKVYAAFLVDVADAKRVAAAVGEPTKYDSAILQATAYANCLKQHGIIQ